jgi:hypothetical protein
VIMIAVKMIMAILVVFMSLVTDHAARGSE